MWVLSLPKYNYSCKLLHHLLCPQVGQHNTLFYHHFYHERWSVFGHFYPNLQHQERKKWLYLFDLKKYVLKINNKWSWQQWQWIKCKKSQQEESSHMPQATDQCQVSWGMWSPEILCIWLLGLQAGQLVCHNHKKGGRVCQLWVQEWRRCACLDFSRIQV